MPDDPEHGRGAGAEPGPGREAAVALLATLHQCHFDLGEYAIRIWGDYDFGGDSQVWPTLETRRVDDAYCAEVGSTLDVALRPGVTNSFYLRLLLWFSPGEAWVESSVEAHLEEPVGTYAPGSYVLHERRTAGLDLDGALRAAREHLEVLYRNEDYPKLLGLNRK